MRNNKRVGRRTQRFADGVSNALLRIGPNTQNTFQKTRYIPEFKSMERNQLEWAYQGSWICGLAVDIIAEDMTREGVDIKASDPAVVDKINTQMDDLGVWNSLCDAIKWSRLYGGSIAVMLIDGDDMSKPLGKIRPGSFKGLYVLDRWQLDQTLGSTVQTLGADFGKPEFYTIVSGSSDVSIPSQRIHYSRVIRFEGRRLPYNIRRAYNGWGASILETVFDRIAMFDLATEGAAQLLSKAYLRYYKVEGLRDILTNDLAAKGFLKQMDYIRMFQGIEGMTLGDSSDDFQTMTYTFTGIPEVMLQIGQQISGAIGVPLVRLFGQSPTGFNSTGESDLRTYYDNVKHDQDSDLRPGMKRLLNVMYESEMGTPPGDDFSFEFKSLWQMTNEQKAQAATGMAGAIIQALQADAITTSVAMKELRKLSDVIGLFSSISDEDIDEAEEMDNGLMPPALGGMNEGQVENGVSGAEQNSESKPLVQETSSANRQAG
jgi:phage-related protein (TIGR01555 family)